MSGAQSPALFRYQLICVFRTADCCLCRDIETGDPAFSMRRSRGAADYEEHYRISEEEVDLFLEDFTALADFATRIDRRELEERRIPPSPPIAFPPAAAPRFQAMYVNRQDRYALERDRATGAPVFSIPVSNATADYLEYYAISEAEFMEMVRDKRVAMDFARRCGRREMDNRLIIEPGSDRGTY